MSDGFFNTCGFCWRPYPAGENHMCDALVERNHKILEDVRQRAEEQAPRYDADKSRLDLIDPGFLLRLGDQYAVGAQKYAERNWQKGMRYSRCYASAQRHMLAFWSGEDVDAESGTRHVIAAAWNMAAVDYYMSNPKLSESFDDRPNKTLA